MYIMSHTTKSTVLNIYVSNHRCVKHKKQEGKGRTKRKMDKSTIRFGDFTTLLTIDITHEQKITKGI